MCCKTAQHLSAKVSNNYIDFLFEENKLIDEKNSTYNPNFDIELHQFFRPDR